MRRLRRSGTTPAGGPGLALAVAFQGRFGLVGEGSERAPGGVGWCESAACKQRLKAGPIHPRKLKTWVEPQQHAPVMCKAEGRTGQEAMALNCSGEIQVRPKEKVFKDSEAGEQTARESRGAPAWGEQLRCCIGCDQPEQSLPWAPGQPGWSWHSCSSLLCRRATESRNSAMDWYGLSVSSSLMEPAASQTSWKW